MDTKALRQKILDLAIRGKLVPQDPTDEPASVLLERIRAERQRLVKEGRLKAKDVKNDSIIYKDPSDNLHYEKFSDGTIKCIEDEIPFDIPESWCWTRLGNISSMSAGKFKASAEIGDKSADKPFPCYGGNGIRGYVKNYSHEGFYHLIGRQGALCGNINIASGKFYATEHAVVVTLFQNTNFYWIYYLLCALNLNQYSTGAAQPGLSVEKILNTIVPLPPHNEQKLIACHVDNVLTRIKLLDSSQDELKNYITILKSKILDLAIRGKLVPQDPNDEPASVLLERIKAEKEELIKQGKIKRDKAESTIFKGDDNSYYEKVGDDIKCIDCEIPFDLPHSWIWARLKTCCNTPIKRGKAPKYISKSNTLVFAQKCNTKSDDINLSLAQFLDESSLIKYSQADYLQHNDIVINSTGTGTLGRVGLYSENDNRQDFNVVPDSHISVVRITKELNAEIIYFWLKLKQPVLEHEGEGSTNQKELRSEYLSNILIPIPPFNEQRRIVDQIKTIIQKLKNIEESINN